MQRQIWVVLVCVGFLPGGCAGSLPKEVEGAAPPKPKGCAIIITDDDIPSGSATAGALYVKDAALGKRLLTADVVAAAKGFQRGGFTCVHVLDSHNGAIDTAPLRAIGVPVLTPSTTKDWRWPFIGPMQKKATAAALIGYHSNAETRGFRPHTINDSVRSLKLNGRTVGEVTHLIMGLGAFGVPVVLVSGDMNATAEAGRIVPGVSKITVRWLGPAGKPRFLSGGEAAVRLEAAACAAASTTIKPYRPELPLHIELELYSTGLMAHQSRSIARTFRSQLKKAPEIQQRLSGFDFGASMAVDKTRLSWRVDDALTAFVTIVFAASHLRGARNYEQVDEGYAAFEAGDDERAVKAYRAALATSPFDLATKCRLAAVYRGLWRHAAARDLFAEGVARLDEIGGIPMKTWCLLGLARARLALGETAGAARPARRVLKLKASKRRRSAAQEILQLIEAGKADARQVFLRLEELRFIMKKIETVYSYLDIKQKHHGFSYPRLKEEYLKRVRAATSDADYRALLQQFLARFHDGHLRIKGENSPLRSKSKLKQRPPAVTHRWLDGSVLVTRIRRLYGDEKRIAGQLNEGLARLKRARALIVDLRGNGGGNDALAFDYLSHIVEREIPLGRFSLRMSPLVMRLRPHYRKLYEPDPARPGFSKWRGFSIAPKTSAGFGGPIAVLIDKACYSSCEGAALALKNSGRAHLFGQNTGGGSANPVLIKLPMTPGKLMIPTWIQIMPDGDLLEDNGVPPDVRLSASKDALSTALVHVRKKTR